ncbi:MAG: hypothetical protein NXI24_24820 [bacterium]|nr:hypothetical protein [bacterium]
MKDAEQVLDELKEDIYQRFHRKCKFNHFSLLAVTDSVISVCMVFKTEKDRKKYEKNAGGIQKELIGYLKDHLKDSGDLKLGDFELHFEIDSEEAEQEALKNQQNGNAPTDEDLARAKAFMREKNRGLSEVGEHIKERFKTDGVHQCFVFYSSQADSFGAFIFYDHDHQIQEAEKSGLAERIKDEVLYALEEVGRGERGTLQVEFEFDSHDNVERNYEGDYFLRLR